MKNSIYVITIVFFTVIFFSCKKEIVYEGITGELKGHVSLASESTDYSGILVTVDGSNPLKQTTTTSDGSFTISGLKTGIYDLIFTKEGFCTYKVYGYQFIGGNLPSYVKAVNLYKLSNYSIANFKMDTVNDSPYSYITLKAETESPYCRFYISHKPDVSYINYEVSGITYSSSEKINYYMNPGLLQKFPAGIQLYAIVYPCINTYDYYIHIETGNMIYPVNPDKASPVVPFKVPQNQIYLNL